MPNTGHVIGLPFDLKNKKKDAGGSEKPVTLLPWPYRNYISGTPIITTIHTHTLDANFEKQQSGPTITGWAPHCNYNMNYCNYNQDTHN